VSLIAVFICVHSNGPVVGTAIGCWVDLDAGGETEAGAVGGATGRKSSFITLVNERRLFGRRR
jgi:hypothetical protein